MRSVLVPVDVFLPVNSLFHPVNVGSFAVGIPLPATFPVGAITSLPRSVLFMAEDVLGGFMDDFILPANLPTFLGTEISPSPEVAPPMTRAVSFESISFWIFFSLSGPNISTAPSANVRSFFSFS